VNRFVWNKALAINLSRLENKQSILWYNEMDFWTKLWKASDEYSFLKTVHSQTLQQTLKNLEKAFKDGFDKKQPLKRIPKFKRKGQSDSFKYPQGFKLSQDKSRVFLPKIGWVKYRNSRQVIGDLKNCTVSRRGKHWYIAIQVEYEVNIQHHASTSIVGIDLGVTRFATLSDGSYIQPLNSFRKLSKRLAFAQKRLSKKVKFSANWKKQKQQISKIHESIANARLDFLHKTSTYISKNHAMIVLEDLRVKNMSKSAKGNMTRPGKNVKAKSGLNKSILDQGWGLFTTMLEYKQDWSGGEVLKVPAHYTSQTCPSCHHVSKENRKSQSAFACTECGFKANADHVGALNVLERGHRLLACGVETLASTMKQELVGSSNTRPLLSA
jgi:putative transposase